MGLRRDASVGSASGTRREADRRPRSAGTNTGPPHLGTIWPAREAAGRADYRDAGAAEAGPGAQQAATSTRRCSRRAIQQEVIIEPCCRVVIVGLEWETPRDVILSGAREFLSSSSWGYGGRGDDHRGRQATAHRSDRATWCLSLRRHVGEQEVGPLHRRGKDAPTSGDGVAKVHARAKPSLAVDVATPRAKRHENGPRKASTCCCAAPRSCCRARGGEGHGLRRELRAQREGK